MALWLKYLPCRPEDQSSDPQNPKNIQLVWQSICDFSLRKQAGFPEQAGWGLYHTSELWVLLRDPFSVNRMQKSSVMIPNINFQLSHMHMLGCTPHIHANMHTQTHARHTRENPKPILVVSYLHPTSTERGFLPSSLTCVKTYPRNSHRQSLP